MSGVAIRVQEISKRYLFSGGKRNIKDVLAVLAGKPATTSRDILKDVNLTIEHGEIVGIVGRNGAGKSTLLKLLTGVIRPTTGKISVEGKISAILELGMGLNPELNGYQNIRFIASTRGLKSSVIESKMQDIADFAEIGEYINYPARTYSTGMRARLAFSIATTIAPDILIIDEVLAVGDALFQRKCYQRIHELLDNNTTVLLVTHDLSSVRRLCSRALLIEGGSVIADGDPKTITRQYENLITNLEHNTLKNKSDNSLSVPGSSIIDSDFSSDSGLTDLVSSHETSIVDFETQTTTELLKHDRRYVVRVRFTFSRPLAEISFGISIKNHKGEAICGEISPAYGRSISIPANQPMEVSWQIDAMMLNGTYFLSVDIRTAKRSKSIFTGEDIASFRVDGTPQGRYVGMFVPTSKMSVEQCK